MVSLSATVNRATVNRLCAASRANTGTPSGCGGRAPAPGPVSGNGLTSGPCPPRHGSRNSRAAPSRTVRAPTAHTTALTVRRRRPGRPRAAATGAPGDRGRLRDLGQRNRRRTRRDIPARTNRPAPWSSARCYRPAPMFRAHRRRRTASSVRVGAELGGSGKPRISAAMRAAPVPRGHHGG